MASAGRLTLDYVEINGWTSGSDDLSASRGGGAILVQLAGAVLMATEVLFVGNSATADGCPGGGAVYIYEIQPTIRLIDCDFVDNTDGGSGGAAVFWKNQHHAAVNQCVGGDDNWYQQMHGGADVNSGTPRGDCSCRYGWGLQNGEGQSFYRE